MIARYLSNLLLVSLVLFSTLRPAIASDPASLSSEEALRARVEAAWQAKKDDDLEKVYAMTDQKFRKSVKLNKFLRGNSLVVQSYSIAKVEIDPANQDKGYSLVYFKTVNNGVPLQVSIKEAWLNEDGIWNVKYSDLTNPFDTKNKSIP